MDELTEKRIVAGLREGDEEAWFAFYDATAARLWRLVGRYVGSDRGAIGDVVQETFLVAAKSTDQYDESRGRLFSWLGGIGRRQAALYLRKRGQTEIRGLAMAREWGQGLNGELGGLFEGGEGGGGPVEILESRELVVLVRASLGEMEEGAAAVLESRYLEGESAVVIGERLGVSSDVVRTRLVRARRKFRDVFERLSHSGQENGGAL